MFMTSNDGRNSELEILSLPELKRLLVTCADALIELIKMPTSVELIAEAYGAMRRLNDAVRAEIERQEADDNATRQVPPLHE